jgi:hypothetical protein
VKFKEKEKPVCVARDKEFAYDWVTFYTEVAHCPRANLLFPYPPCPASTCARWKCGGKKYGSMDNLFLYLDKSPEFLAACSKCLGEGEVVDAEITVNDRVDALEKRVNKITEGYERMFGYLDIISKAVMTFIREKEEKK